MAANIKHGPIGPNAVHLCVDMQRLFGPGGPWHVPWAAKVLPAIHDLARFHPERTIFTRFIPPRDLASATGCWRRYYQKWPGILGESLPPAQLDLLPELADFVPPARVKDKSVYSPWQDGELHRFLHKAEVDTLVISGGETDICVMATALGAVDRGYRTILVSDAVCSSLDEAHDAAMTMFRLRFSEQVEAIPLEEVLENWRG